MPTQPTHFELFKQLWHSGNLEEKPEKVQHFMTFHPLFHETLRMQGTALAVLDINTMKYPLILGDVQKVCGWSTEHFYEVGVQGYVELYPEEDQAGLIHISREIGNYSAQISPENMNQLRVIYDYRMKGNDGKIRRICQESMALSVDETGKITYFVAFVSEITNVKRDGKQHLFLSGGKQSKLFEIDSKTNECTSLESLSQRELEIAQLMGQGYLSKEISDKLFIANNTVNTHRQNMLRKTNFYDANELINFLRIYRII